MIFGLGKKDVIATNAKHQHSQSKRQSKSFQQLFPGEFRVDIGDNSKNKQMASYKQ